MVMRLKKLLFIVVILFLWGVIISGGALSLAKYNSSKRKAFNNFYKQLITRKTSNGGSYYLSPPPFFNLEYYWPELRSTTKIVNDRTRPNLWYISSGKNISIFSMQDKKVLYNIKTEFVVEDFYYDQDSQLLYAAEGKGGVEIWNLQIELDPQKTGKINPDCNAINLNYHNNILYIACGKQGLYRADVTNSLQPVLDKVNIDGIYEKVFVNDSFVVATGNNTIKLIKYIDNAPVLITEESFDKLFDIELKDNFIILSYYDKNDGSNIDIREIASNSSKLNRIESYRLTIPGIEIKLIDNELYVTENNRLFFSFQLFDLSGPWNIKKIPSNVFDNYRQPVADVDKNVDNNSTTITGFALGYNEKVDFFIKSPSQYDYNQYHTLDFRMDYPSLLSFDKKADYTFVGTDKGIEIFKTSTNGLFEHIKTFNSDFSVFDLVIDNNKAFIAAGNNGIMLIDISNPAEPQLVDRISDIGDIKFLFKENQKIYAVQSSELENNKIYQLKNNNSKLTITKIYDIPQTLNLKISNITIKNSLLFVSTVQHGIRILNLSTGNFLNISNELSYLSINSVDIEDNNLFILNESGNLVVYDISNLRKIKQISNISLMQYSTENNKLDWKTLTAHDGIIVAGPTVVDVTDPVNSKKIYYFELFENASKQKIIDNYLYTIKNNRLFVTKILGR